MKKTILASILLAGCADRYTDKIAIIHTDNTRDTVINSYETDMYPFYELNSGNDLIRNGLFTVSKNVKSFSIIKISKGYSK